MPHPRHPKIAQNPPRLAPRNAAIVNLRGARIAVHLGQLELGLGTGSLGESRVPDDVAQGLSLLPAFQLSPLLARDRKGEYGRYIPLRFILLEDFPDGKWA